MKSGKRTSPRSAVASLTLAPELPMQQHVDAYVAYKKLRTSEQSQRGYIATLRELVNFYPHLELAAFEPQAGTRLIEDFLVAKWGERAPRTFNKNLSTLNDFFKWLVIREHILRSPTIAIERVPVPEPTHDPFTKEQRARILAVNPATRDQIALRLLLDYALRKGSLLDVRLGSFDRHERKLTYWMKGDRQHVVPIPESDRIWELLARLDDEPASHYLLFKRVMRRRRPPEKQAFVQLAADLEKVAAGVAALSEEMSRFELDWATSALDTTRDWLHLAEDAASFQTVDEVRDEPMGIHPAHDWWYHCLYRAGIVERGVTSGRRMHGARHTAAQRVLEQTGNLKAAQKVLGHKNVATTDVYTGWDHEHTRQSLADTVPAGRLDEALLRAASSAGRERSRA